MNSQVTVGAQSPERYNFCKNLSIRQLVAIQHNNLMSGYNIHLIIAACLSI